MGRQQWSLFSRAWKQYPERCQPVLGKRIEHMGVKIELLGQIVVQLIMVQLQNILPPRPTTGVLNGPVKLQLHLLPFQHKLGLTRLLLLLLLLMVDGMQLLPQVGNKVVPLPQQHLLLTGSKRFDSSQRSSTTSRITKKQKGHHGGLGETTTIAHQEVARDKATCHKRQTHKQHPLMKVGSMVLLMTSKYPNKANVAFVALLSADPEAIVGGVKIGSQFYKVRIDHPIAKDEPLVRPMPGCNNIGDAQAKGVPIAWPSMFVEMING